MIAPAVYDDPMQRQRHVSKKGKSPGAEVHLTFTVQAQWYWKDEAHH